MYDVRFQHPIENYPIQVPTLIDFNGSENLFGSQHHTKTPGKKSFQVSI
jgi:hypothetical protein